MKHRFAWFSTNASMLSALALLAARSTDSQAVVPEACSEALDRLLAELWRNADGALLAYCKTSGSLPSFGAAIQAALSEPPPTREKDEEWAGFQTRLATARVVLDGAVALATSVAMDQRASAPAPETERSAGENQPPSQLELALGIGLVPLVKDGQLLSGIARTRKELEQRYGFAVAPIRVCDDLSIPNSQYSVQFRGKQVATGSIEMDRMLAIDPEDATLPSNDSLDWKATKEPAFGLQAYWIPPAQRALAEQHGFTVVDPGTVVVTHLQHTISVHIEQLFGLEELRIYLNDVESWAPGVVAEIIPNRLSQGTVLAALRRLLSDEISIGDVRTIIETMTQAQADDVDALVVAFRAALATPQTH